jgi:hypothetical protein
MVSVYQFRRKLKPRNFSTDLPQNRRAEPEFPDHPLQRAVATKPDKAILEMPTTVGLDSIQAKNIGLEDGPLLLMVGAIGFEPMTSTV